MSEAVVNLAAIAENIRVIRERVAPAELMIVVKADGYGHGAEAVARTALASGVRWLGVLTAAEGVRLRAAGIDARMFAWLHDPDDDFQDAVAADIELGLSTSAQLERLAELGPAATGAPARVHLKIDTGLHRDGASVEEWPSLVRRAVELQRAGVLQLVAVWSHIAEASDEEDDLARSCFEQAAMVAEAALSSAGFAAPMRHLAASAAGWLRPEFRYQLVRVGAHALGIPVFEGGVASEMGLVPALELRSAITEVRVGAEPAAAIQAVIPLGAADGLPAAASENIHIVVSGRPRPVLHIAADHLLVPAEETDAPGDPVLLFGTGASGEPTVRQWADAADTIGEEIVSQLPATLSRRYLPASGYRVMQETVVNSAEELGEIAAQIAAQLVAGDLIILTGPLGAGKTTFTRALGEALRVRGPVTSPTFVIARTHPSLNGGPALVHVDAYRLSSAAELDDLDLDYQHSIVVVEWGAGLLDGVADSWLEIVLQRPEVAPSASGADAGDASAESALSDSPLITEQDAAEPRRVRVTGFGLRWAE